MNDVSYKEGFGREITTEEVESAIFRLKTGTAPGPDNHYSEFFKNAEENFIKAMEVMMNAAIVYLSRVLCAQCCQYP